MFHFFTHCINLLSFRERNGTTEKIKNYTWIRHQQHQQFHFPFHLRNASIHQFCDDTSKDSRSFLLWFFKKILAVFFKCTMSMSIQWVTSSPYIHKTFSGTHNTRIFFQAQSKYFPILCVSISTLPSLSQIPHFIKHFLKLCRRQSTVDQNPSWAYHTIQILLN